MSEWKEYKLKEFAKIQTGPFGSQLHSYDYVTYGTPSIMPTNIGNRLNIVTNQIVYISDEDIERLEKYTVKENDIVYSRRGDVEKCAFITKIQSGWLCGTGCLRIRFISESIFPKFCAYYLSTPDIKSWVLNSAVGTTMPNLNTSILGELPIILPSINEQKIIASLLSSLDDKIDLLHRQNKTLEQLAETLFRQWFVEEAEESWEEITFGEIVKPKRGKNITKAEAVEGKYPVVAGGLEPSCYHNQSNTAESVITISSSGANAGFVRLYYNSVWAADCSFIDETVTPYLFFSYIFLKTNQHILFDKQVGSAQPHIYPSHIMELEMMNYSELAIKKFEKEVSPYFQKIKSNQTQIRTLTQLRDTLLPKLMSGEVRVTD